ncbi:hypothetical protein PIROE2DRAFT_14495, partial [Piromyces sp. E2]
MSGNELNESIILIEKRKRKVFELEYVDVIDPKYDIAFKRLFLNEKELMTHFLNSVLNLQDKIEDVEFMDIEIVPVIAQNSIIKKSNKNNE